MNNVSWFLYASEVFGNMQPALAVGGVCAIVGAVPTLIISNVDDVEQGKTWGKRLIIGGIIAVFVAVLIPSKTTMYAIAASQIGETVVATPEAREMIDDSKQILRDYLKSLKKEPASK